MTRPLRSLSCCLLAATLGGAAAAVRAETLSPGAPVPSCGSPPVVAAPAEIREAFRAVPPVSSSPAAKAETRHRIVCRFYVIRSSAGESDFDLRTIDRMMEDLNVGFRDTPFYFVREPDVVFVDRDEYLDFPDFASMIPLVNEFYTEGVFNWYIVPAMHEGRFYASTWYGPPRHSGERGILMQQDVVGTPSNIVTPPHEMGHGLGLWHPFETAFGVECTDGSNCAIAGDLVCDTPASPLLYAANTTATGVYFGGQSGPCPGDPVYDPDPTLYMDAGWPAGHILRDTFSPEQIETMEFFSQRDQADLFGPARPEVVVDCDDDGFDDAEEILAGRRLDRNRDMVPDRCQVRADRGDLVVTGMTSDDRNRPRVFDPATGSWRTDLWHGLGWAHQARLGPDGLVWIPSLTVVARVDLVTGRTRDIVLDGVLDGATVLVDVAFADDGTVLVLDNVDAQIRRYDPSSSELVEVLARLGTVGMSSPKAMARAPDGSLLVVGNGALGDSVQRVDGVTGEVLAPLVAPGGPHLGAGQGILVTDDEVWVSDGARHAVVRFDLATGEWLGDLVAPATGGLSNPHAVVLDRDGSVLVASRGSGSVLRFDRHTGGFLGAAVPPGAGGGGDRGGVVQPAGLLIVPPPAALRRDGVARSVADESLLEAARAGGAQSARGEARSGSSTAIGSKRR